MGRFLQVTVVAGVLATGLVGGGPVQAHAWQELPDEVILQEVLPRLPARDLLQACQADHRVRGLCADPALWQHQLRGLNPTELGQVSSIHPGLGPLVVAEDQRRQITTIAGTGQQGFGGDGGPATTAHLNFPMGVGVDAGGNVIVTDTHNHRIRRIDALTGVITTIAGTGQQGFGGEGGPATTAHLNYPVGVVADAGGNLIVTDTHNHRIRRIDALTGVITTIAGTGQQGFGGDGGPATTAHLNYPRGVGVDAGGNVIVTDTHNHRIRRIDALTGVITTIAGTGQQGFGGEGGPATTAHLNYPVGVVADAGGNLIVTDTHNHRIRRVDGVTGVITTIAGTGQQGFGGDGGPATTAHLNFPMGVGVDAGGNVIVTDTDNHRIRRIDALTGVITTIAGTGQQGFGGEGGPATTAHLNYPVGVGVDAGGNVIVVDMHNDRIRRFGLTE